MHGRMMQTPLLVSGLIEHAGRVHHDRPIVTRTVEGPIHRSTWGEVRSRSKQLANRLRDEGIVEGDRLATLAWNSHRHLEIYYATSGMGAIIHTLNPRLHPREIVYVLNHAEDRIVFLHPTFLPIAEAVANQLTSVKSFVVLTDDASMPETRLPAAISYESFIAGESPDLTWPPLDESAAAALCYTSGTTGRPKGVLYSHRSTVLHAMGVATPDVFNLSRSVSCLPIVPMFHACAWGLPYAAAVTGAGLVMPGPGMDPASLDELLRTEGVDFCAGVPSVFHGLVQHWRGKGERPPDLSMVLLGGAAPPPSLIEALEDEFGIELRHGWGMTETSPLGTVNTLGPEHRSLSPGERVALQAKQGRPPYGVEARIVDEEGRRLPEDGVTFGELQVRGPWVADGYFKLDEEATTHDGWFPTGDVASIDADFRIRITDRTKDLIKSGGEWISSIDVENAAAGHPSIDRAAVIGVPDERWGERPLLIAVASGTPAPAEDDVRDYLARSLAKWQLPDRVIFVDDLPMGGTGKVQKTKLRELYASAMPGPSR